MAVRNSRDVPPPDEIKTGVELNKNLKPLDPNDLRRQRKFLTRHSYATIMFIGLLIGLRFERELLTSPLIRFVGAMVSVSFYLLLMLIGSLIWLVSGDDSIVKFAWDALPWDIPVIQSVQGVLPFALLPAQFCYSYMRGQDDSLFVKEGELFIKRTIAFILVVILALILVA